MLLFRRFRGLVRTAAAWAIAWTPLPFVVHALTGWFSGVPASIVARVVLGYAVSGALAGLVFGGVLIAAERNNALRRIPRWRFALWGAAGAVAFPLLAAVAGYLTGRAALMGPGLLGILPHLGFDAALGALCASGTLALARRAPPAIGEGGDPVALPPPAASRGSLTSA
jgi:hypothetical protein